MVEILKLEHLVDIMPELNYLSPGEYERTQEKSFFIAQGDYTALIKGYSLWLPRIILSSELEEAKRKAYQHIENFACEQQGNLAVIEHAQIEKKLKSFYSFFTIYRTI